MPSTNVQFVGALMRQRGESLEEAERRGLAQLESELGSHSALAAAAFDLLGTVLTSAPERPLREVAQSLKVTTALLVRLSNDLRSAVLLANRGYALQAVSLVASIYEVAYTIVFIGSDNALAQEWIDHDDPTRPFREIRTMTQDALARLGASDPSGQASRQYRIYRQLCMAKHANPLLQTQHGYQIVDGNAVAMNGPDTSEPAIRAAWFSLEHAIGLAGVAMMSFAINHLPPEVSAELRPKIKAIETKRAELSAVAKTRWGTEDPLPGKWRM